LDDKIAALLKENQPTPQIVPASSDDKFDVLLKAIEALKGSVAQSGTVATTDEATGPTMSMEELAKITQKSVEAISSEFKEEEKPPAPKVRKIKLSTGASDLAKELE